MNYTPNLTSEGVPASVRLEVGKRFDNTPMAEVSDLSLTHTGLGRFEYAERHQRLP